MQAAGFVAHCPYEVGDKVNITLHGGIGIVGGPVTARSAEVTITDILAVHSVKRNQVTFMYEINDTKVLKLVDWEVLKHEK